LRRRGRRSPADHVIPFVPIRQFVLSFPHRLRYLLAYDHDRCIAVLRIFIRAVLGFYRERARERDIAGGRTGPVTFIQRFGSACNLNLHVHAIVLDGVFVDRGDRQLSCHPAEPPRDADIARLLDTIVTRIQRHFGRKGLVDDDSERADPLRVEAPLLADCYETSIGSRRTVGQHPGARWGAPAMTQRRAQSSTVDPCRPASTASTCTPPSISSRSTRTAALRSRGFCATAPDRRLQTTAWPCCRMATSRCG
jgi:hypothetical protein